jgi:hypothetical protein
MVKWILSSFESLPTTFCLTHDGSSTSMNVINFLLSIIASWNVIIFSSVYWLKSVNFRNSFFSLSILVNFCEWELNLMLVLNITFCHQCQYFTFQYTWVVNILLCCFQFRCFSLFFNSKLEQNAFI